MSRSTLSLLSTLTITAIFSIVSFSCAGAPPPAAPAPAPAPSAAPEAKPVTPPPAEPAPAKVAEAAPQAAPAAEPEAAPAPEKAPEPPAAKEPELVTVRIPVEIKATTLFADGSIDDYTVSEWDPSLKDLQTQTRYTTSGAVTEQIKFESKDGMILSKTSYDAEGKVVSIRTFTRDASGKVVEEALTEGSGKPISSFSYGYDADGNRTKWIIKDAKGATLASTTYAYKEGKLVKSETLDSGDRKTGNSEYSYNSDGTLKAVTVYDFKGRVNRVEATIWKDGRISAEERRTAGGKVLQRVSYLYGEDGQIQEKLSEDLAGKSVIKTVYEYAFREEQRPAVSK